MGLTLQFLTGKGVFAREGVDAGSRLLLQQWLGAAPSDFAGALLDLGCGWGVLSAFAAARFPRSRVFAVDLNPRAAQLAAHNFSRNELANATSWSGDGLDAARRDCFDVVLCNPPVRAGNAVIGKLFEDARAGLREGGELWIVLRTAQGAKSWQKKLAATWGNCETVALDQGYRVLRSRK